MLRFVVWKLSLHVVLTSALIYVIFVAILKKKTVLDKWSEWNETKAWKPEVFHGRSKARINLVASDTKEKRKNIWANPIVAFSFWSTLSRSVALQLSAFAAMTLFVI